MSVSFRLITIPFAHDYGQTPPRHHVQQGELINLEFKGKIQILTNLRFTGVLSPPLRAFLDFGIAMQDCVQGRYELHS